jgi:hypothetical protein
MAIIPFDRVVGCHYSFLHENLMDMTHQVLHRRWMGDFMPKFLGARWDDDRVEVDYAANFSAGSLYVRTLPSIILNLQRFVSIRDTHIDEEFPAGVERGDYFVTIATTYPYQSLTLQRAGVAQPLLRLWLSYIPMDLRHSATRTLGALMVRKPWVPGLLKLLQPLFIFFADRIFHEDRLAMEAEQQAYDACGRDENQETAPFLLALRALLLARGVAIGDTNTGHI